jgi:hypothetical protein
MTPPGVNVCPYTIYVDPEAAVNISDPTVKIGALVVGTPEARIEVTPLITTAVPVESKEMVVSATVMTAPGLKVRDPIKYDVPLPGSGLKTPLPIVSGGGVTCATGVAIVLETPFITTTFGAASDRVVAPSIVIAGLLGARVWPLMIKLPCSLAVTFDEASVISGFGVEASSANVEVAWLTTMKFDPSERVVASTIMDFPNSKISEPKMKRELES